MSTCYIFADHTTTTHTPDESGNSWGILLHSSCKAAPKAWSVLGRGTLCRTRWPRMSQTCSIGDKSRDRAGQSRWSTSFCCRNCYFPRPMRSCVVILQHYEQKAEQPCCIHFIDVALACQSSVKHKQLCFGNEQTCRPIP